ncbi:MAG: phosphotransferase family protein [Pseudomonadota bacterium]|nr:phosphotransferase family protein [Pseudomonadota bacterium]
MDTAKARTFDPDDMAAIGRRLREFMTGLGLSGVELGAMRRYTSGFSWATYGFSAAWREDGREVRRELILRVGPPGGIFAPYRASPEFITLGALTGTDVPVPGVYWYSDGSVHLGAPFFVCDFVAGEVPIPWTHDGGPAFDDAARLNLGGQFVEALAALHGFEWQGTPVAGIGGSTDPARAALDQVDAWEANLARWSPVRVPILEWAAIWLRAHAPVAPRISITHGDYRIGNFLVVDGRITAILDWELVQLGDPVEDLGWICLQAWRGRSPHMCHFFSREELRDRYAALAGFEPDMAAIRYWEAFGTYKLAIMHYAARHSFDALGFNDLRLAGMAAQIPRMLLQVEQAMERAA